MILWTFQPLEIWEQLQKAGIYRCDPAFADPDFIRAYGWIARKMRERIGPPPEGAGYPVWAWHTQRWKHKKPDLRRERWHCGPGNEMYACIEIEIPDSQVLLSDFDEWHCVLNGCLVSDTEEENEKQDENFSLNCINLSSAWTNEWINRN